MSEMVGDLLQSEASIQELARAGVTEAVGTAALKLHALLCQPRPDQLANRRDRQGAKWRIEREEQCPRCTAWACVPNVSKDGIADCRRQRVAVISALLRPGNVQSFTDPVQIFQGQPLNLAASEAIVEQ